MKAPQFTVKVIPASDQAFLVVFGTDISPETHAKVKQFIERIRELRGTPIVSVQPAYASVLLKFDPLRTDAENLHDELVSQISKIDPKGLPGPSPDPFTIPVCYEDPFAPDLAQVMAHTRLSREEVVGLHSQTSYHAYFLGFMPGFAYLGGLPARLSTPRLPSPRLKIPAGSVGIAGEQTGVYPIPSPGGWQLIGRTPLILFDGRRNPANLLSAGQDVRFQPISLEEYKRLGGKWDS